MFILYANKTQLKVRQREPTTSGSANVYTVQFEFSPDWEGLTRTAVFKAGAASQSVPLGGSNTCTIPWEVLERYHPLTQLQAGVYGTRGGEEVLPTIWASLGTIQEGAAPGENVRSPWEQALAQKQDKLHGLPGQVVGFNEEGEAVAQDAAGGGAEGPPGPQGEPGPSGVGVPAGGMAGQALVKASGEDYDTQWTDWSEGGGTAYQFGHGLKVAGITVSVDAANDFTGDNTRPVTAAAVESAVGNIETLLTTI